MQRAASRLLASTSKPVRAVPALKALARPLSSSSSPRSGPPRSSLRARAATPIADSDTHSRHAAAPTGQTTPFIEPAGRNPAEDFQPFNAALQEFGGYLMASLPKFVQQTSVYKDELTLYVAPTAVVPVMTFLRDHTNTQYKQVIDICGVDFPTRSSRFEVVYHLLSVKHDSRIRVKTYADEVSPVPSVTPLFAGADWCGSYPAGRHRRATRS